MDRNRTWARGQKARGTREIYGVISYSVGQRTHEIGIRMALGATAGHLQRRILLQTMGLAAAGMGIGLAFAGLLTGAPKGLLFGITSTDPATFAGMLSVLGAVAALAGYLPGRRASRINPMVALRADQGESDLIAVSVPNFPLPV